MRISTNKKAAGIIILLLVSCSILRGQTRDELVKVYNAGAKTAQTNVDSAIISFENVILMSEKIGQSADDLKQKAAQVLPGLYLKSASAMLTAKKPEADIVRTVKKALTAADKYGNASVKDNAGKMLSQAYGRMGTEFFKNKGYEKALVTFDSLLAINPEYLPAIYNKALIYRIQNNSEALEQTVDLYLGKLQPGDEKANQASRMALEYFRLAGSKAIQANQLDNALIMLNKAAKYGEDKDLFYYFADLYNKQKDFDKGAEFAQKGLALEKGNSDLKAKYFYQLAVAQAAKGQNAEACESFKNAMYGAFAEASKAQRTNLKCQ